MKINKYRSLLWLVGFNQPATHEEYNQLAEAKPGEDPCLESSNDNLAYRGQMPPFRTKIVDLVEQTLAKVGDDKVAQAPEYLRTSKKETRTAKDGTTKTVTVITEKDGEYLKRVAALVFPGDPEALDKLAAQFDSQAQAIGLAVPCDLKEVVKAVKGAKAPKFAKHITETVDGMITAGKAERLAKYLTKVLGHEVAPDAASLYAGVAEEEVIESRKRLANKVG